MIHYFYKINVDKNKKKYLVEKLIMQNKNIISKDILYFSKKNLYTLIKNLDSTQYSLPDNNDLIYNKLISGNLNYP